MTTNQQIRADCPCCGTNRLVPLRGYESSHLRLCQQCQFVCAAKVPTASELEEHYAHKYNKKYAPDAWVSETTRHRLAELIASFSSYRANNRLLDVGCGRGLLLETAQDAGWSCFGTEYSTDTISLGVNRGFTMHEGELGDNAFPHEHFDVIVMLESIEHMPEPRDAMLTISRLLRVGGALYLSTPNFDSLSRRVLRSKWNVIEYPAHLSYFSAKALTTLLESCGLSPVKLESTGFSPTRFKKSLLGQGHATTASADADERVRSALEATRQARLLKSAINQGLSMTRLGDTLKVEFVKTKPADTRKPRGVDS